MRLSEIFDAIAYKALVSVDLPDLSSHQHEINGSHRLREFFGEKLTKGSIQWHYFSDSDAQSDFGLFTFYNARERSVARTQRTEWRLYYSGNFLGVANVGDLLILARTREGTLHGLVFGLGSGAYEAALQLFDIRHVSTTFTSLQGARLRSVIEFTRGRILEQLEIVYEEPISKDIAQVVNQYGGTFPDTVSMSRLAVELDGTPPSRADEALVSWIETEEQLFKAFERREALERIRKGFHEVEEFLELALSLLNRRKARMGYALQNHLARLFQSFRLSFVPQAPIDGKPDFLFPSMDAYRDSSFPSELLTMLAAKSTLRERWKDVLSQAARIRPRHVCTIDATLSRNLLSEMMKHDLAVVLPTSLHTRYSADAERLLSVERFIDLVAQRQERAAATGLRFPLLQVAEPRGPRYRRKANPPA